MSVPFKGLFTFFYLNICLLLSFLPQIRPCVTRFSLAGLGAPQTNTF